jgi:hypothetical protein
MKSSVNFLCSLLTAFVLTEAVPASATPAPLLASQDAEASGAPAVSTEAGRAALAAASAIKRGAYATSGEAREALLLDAARAYEQVANETSFGQGDRVEGAFRAGEILRSRGFVEDAVARFREASRMGSDHEHPAVRSFGARGLLELAHVVRRENDLDAALEAYTDVRQRFEKQRRQVAHACTWTIKLLVKAGRLDEAGAVALGLGPFLPDYSLEAVRNVDLIAVALMDAGRTDSAHSAVAHLEAGVRADLADGETVTPQVEGALEALRAKMAASGYSPPQGG